MSIKGNSRHRERFLVAAAVLFALGVPAAQARDGDPVRLGTTQNHATKETWVRLSEVPNQGDETTAFVGVSNVFGGTGIAGLSGEGTGVMGRGGARGVYGVSPFRGGQGVVGEATNGATNGVFGRSEHPGASGVYGRNDAAGFGVAGRSNQPGGTGVFAEAVSGTGVSARGGSNGVEGFSSNANASGVYGRNDAAGFGVAGRSNQPGGTGVFAEALSGTGVSARGGSNGVEGFTSNPSTSGVLGENHGGGFGVAGRSDNPGGTGVLGHSAAGTGVSASGTIGLRATGATIGLTAKGRTGLEVEGFVKLSRSGTVTIEAGSASVTVVGHEMFTDSIVIATLQQNRPGIWVRAAVPVAGSPLRGSFTVHLNKEVSEPTTVAYLILDQPT